MASDLKLEIFASQLFQTFWRKQKFFFQSYEASSMYRDEYHLVSQNEEVYKEFYFKAVFIRCQLFCQVFQKELRENFCGLESSVEYISDYISSTCERDDLFGNLTIFERLFSTCAFVVHLGIFCYKMQYYKDAIKYAHLCWAMYFDKYREDFYRLGGWNQLNIVSVSYVLPYDLLSMCKPIVEKDEYSLILKIIKAIDSYKNFILFSDFDYETTSKAWVTFRFQRLNSFYARGGIVDKKKEQNMRDPEEVENVLKDLKRFCDPCGIESLKEIANIKMPTTIAHLENSKLIHTDSIKNTKDIFRKENILSRNMCVDKYAICKEKNSTCYSKPASFQNLESEENQEGNSSKFEISEITISKAKSLHAPDTFQYSSPHSSPDLMTQSIEIGKHCTEIGFQTQLKQVNPTMNDKIEDKTSTAKTKQTEIYLEENDDKANAMVTKDITQNTESITSWNWNDTSPNSFYLIPQTLNDEFSVNKAQITSEQKLNEVHKKETVLERESADVKILSRLILVLGNQQGIANVRSSLQCLDKRLYKKSERT